nr:NADH dehydrogenase subunit 3 [Cixiidae sp.]
MKIFLFLLTLMTLIMMMSMLIFLISKKSKMDREKSSPFECGFSSMSSARMPFSIHFFLISMIFLMFDIEITLMLPISYSKKFLSLNEWMETSMAIMILVTYGLYHEWTNGMLEWSK